MSERKIKSALISVYHKEGLDDIVSLLNQLKVRIFSTGGTWDHITRTGIRAEKVEDLTTYPSILGGRVKTLHPSVFGGILARRENSGDMEQMDRYGIPEIDLVIVDLYPFGETVRNTDDEAEITEKIDIGGISLIRAAAKNFRDVVVISSRDQYSRLLELLRGKGGMTSLQERRRFAAEAFMNSSHYDTEIFRYYNLREKLPVFRESINISGELRYGENPHQKGIYYGDPGEMFEKLHGKDLSYNNLLDIESAVTLIDEFTETTVIIIKHNNACGAASRDNLTDAWNDALACDPVSAFGGIIAANREIDEQTASAMDKIFFEVLIAPGFSAKALEILEQKKNRIILKRKAVFRMEAAFRSLLNGVLWQERDNSTQTPEDLMPVTPRKPDKNETEDLVFANILVKHSKSNAIVLAKNKQLCASGIGQTSRVDALKQAIEKARLFGFDLKDSVMASDAFFPFPDCVEIAHKAGVTAVVQPGGSVRDKDSIDFCAANGMAMVFTGIRHFKH
ncbi:MAG TPA: bifunctional phosphoribosylaminoimidazolecarboxamide formyltransferase/IMP cyclohydrolase [Bacteroidales bacterium]|jgi:phosphoribosylaminoimidazolecarboxamide formyltransferase/IMP cyclohydrolase|nr:bifunctional phosphoribosylaminoimidazolecarboxamide formyltransferase/IMP cyclohydrolase [Bacteroidales bacterium]HQH24292.1 bifunctional phosphoribosylaminoimidazolecarboxamide formyltransferase/IMP cyclohydrolase [Bacteroidales bacterium]HQJ81528.1 bifunctional phosphoribosylaminoimidazolecarboxamide formyltransferase/IMP cyclohydrolase [Bacteroidales bacterium]